ncbi:glucosamine inositolphosphorylceramide transferase family protein [Terrarubrum flagellatum]|uniref:glucosamine inositolphosphorylceramide transferase family protein n=1 Tax=Terrirubrum flagellatum TaxID=2895980 RepID=UPI0031454FC6
MYIQLLVDPLRLWSWHAALATDLQAAGHRVSVKLAPTATHKALPAGYTLLEALETMTARGRRIRYAKRIARSDIAVSDASNDEAADLIIDTTGTAAHASESANRIALTFDGGEESVAMIALCEGALPTLTLTRGDGTLIASATPAIERPLSLTRALDHLFSRALTLCRSAPRFLQKNGTPGVEPDIAMRRSASFSPVAAKLAARAIAARLAAMVKQGPRWRTGYRIAASDRVIDRMQWPASSYSMLSDDGARFYADPFPVWRGGVCHVFIEEYPFATGKGVLSVFTLDKEGRASTVRLALERPYHLSYPMIFERNGATWMIPETSNARTIELYRADPFPDRWVFERTLVENVIASDMTLLEHGGKLWLLGTLAEEGGSTWDGLGAFVADDLFGAWRAHPANPLLIDASCARPAGFAASTSAGLVRPVQDCRARYGAGLALARIDRLDEEGFAQTVIARLPPDARWKAVGAHTLNESEGVEVVDWIS